MAMARIRSTSDINVDELDGSQLDMFPDSACDSPPVWLLNSSDGSGAQSPSTMSSPSRMSAGSAGNGFGGAATAGGPLQSEDTSGTAAGAIYARPNKPSPCSACGTGFDLDSDYDQACEIGARAMLNKVTRSNCTTGYRRDAHLEQELALLRKAIKENNVLFQRCSCKTPKWAMNWRGRDLSKKQHLKWGAFQNLCDVRRNFRGKEQVDKELKALEERGTAHQTFSTPKSAASSDSAGSKRTRESPGGEPRSVQKKQTQVEAIPPPPPTPAREGDSSRWATSAEIAGSAGSYGWPPTVQSPVQPVAAVQLELQTAAATAAHEAAAHEAAVVEQQASLARIQVVLCQFPWTGVLLHYFLVSEKENLLRNAGTKRQQTEETLEMIHDTIDELWESIQRNQQTMVEQRQRMVFDALQSSICPLKGSLVIYDTTGDKLTKVTDVLKYSFKLLMDQIEKKPDAEKPRSFHRQYIELQLGEQQSVDALEGLFKKFEVKHEWRITHFLPESSFGIFFRVPSWVAELVLFVIEHNVIVKDQLIEQGYRALWPLKRSALLHSNTPSTDLKIAFEGAGDDIPEDYFSLICGYNIRECPWWVPRPDGVSFSGHGISQEHRDLLKALADEYRQRVVLLQEEEEGGEEGEGGEAMEASEAGKIWAEVNQETGSADSSVAPPASTDPHPFTIRTQQGVTASAGQRRGDEEIRNYLPDEAGAAGSSSVSLCVSKQIRTHVFSATEIGAAIAAASAVSSGPEREFDGLVKLLSSCRSLMAVEPVVHFKPETLNPKP